MRLGIYMGSFDPPHKGHIRVVNYLLKNHYVDKILIVPTLGYWDKTNLANIIDRVNMLKYYENDKILIDTKHNKFIYTYELIKEIEKDYPGDKLSIIMGADNIINFDKWKNYQKLLKYNIIVMNRDNIDITKYINKFHGDFTIVKDFKAINISSSEIKKNISNKYLNKKVIDYITKNNLYQ